MLQSLKRELNIYHVLAKDVRTPRVAKWLLMGAVMYAVSPIDLIPDFIPILGQLDDLVILPILVGLALLLIPRDLKDEARVKYS